MRSLVSSPVDSLRRRVVGEAEGLFSHADDPLADTLLYAGDPGLFGPESITWELMGDVSTFIGGIRALLVQAAHPEVVAGVADHSRYREDPLGRLSRTSNYVTATSYGAMPEVDAAVGVVRRAHVRVRGKSHRGIPYTAGDPALAAWVHNSLTDSLLVAAQVFGPTPPVRRGAGTHRPPPRGRSTAGHGRGPRPMGGGAPRRRAFPRHGGGCPVPQATSPEPGGDAQLSADDKGCRCHAPRAVARGPGHPSPPGRDPSWPCVHGLLPQMAGGAPPRGRANPGGPVQAEDALRDDRTPATLTVGAATTPQLVSVERPDPSGARHFAATRRPVGPS
jgi:hypothetical protein